jgi:ABC-2 type transport system ATP-binding protein
MIEVDKLTKTYGHFKAVSEISFSATQGDIVGFLGPNGAGKTTSIRMLSTFLPPSSGTAKIAGFDIVSESDEVRKNIGYLPENPPLYEEMKVTEYLKFVAQIKGVPTKNISSQIDRVLSECYLENVSNKLCRQLSRGYKQRVGLAQAIIHDPKVIILDEPTSGLDPKQIIDIRNTIKSLGKNRTVIFSTHILPEVQAVCNKVVIINRGKVAVSEALEELTKKGSLEQIFMETISSEQAH